MTGLASNALEAVRQAEEAAQKKLLSAKEEGQQLLEKTRHDSETRLKSLKETLMQEEKDAKKQAEEETAKLLAQERKETETKKTALQEKSLKKQDEVVRALIHLVVE